MTTKPLVFVGDIHGNAQALTQILSMYPSEYYYIVWSGDFINSKKPVSDKEIEYVLHIMLTNCHNVLYSNHMHLMYRYLLAACTIKDSDYDSYNSKFIWTQTKRVLDNLHESVRIKLLNHCKSSYFCIHYKNSLMAHAYPVPELINKKFNGILNNSAKKSIGIGRNTNLFWLNPNEELTSLSKEFDYLIVGHHGMITRHDNIRVLDLKGIQVPVWEAETDTIKIFPL